MFANFLKSLLAPEPATLPDPDARLALAALLVRLARADQSYDASEIKRIDLILQKRYALAPAQAAELRTAAETLEQEAPDTVRFTRAIKDAVAHSDRLAIVEAMWDLALTDGMRDQEEDALIRLVTNLLGITDVESAQARQRMSQK